ncbi:MAG: thiamine diphosphokinase [Clostridiales bacterium]|nr:thiamine diphosphokinase [Clostridiales bacterium]
MDKLCVIFGAGEVFAPRKKFGKNDLIIAADGGYSSVIAAGLEPNVVIGDFDSGDMPENTAAHVIKLNRDKDDTDMLAAVKLGLRRGFKTFVIYGGTGGDRLDHTVANFGALAYLNAFGAQGFLIDRDAVATVITDGKFVLPKQSRGTVSVFAYGGVASGVKLENLAYTLDNAELTPEYPLGVSNATDNGTGVISVKSGSLLIFFPR